MTIVYFVIAAIALAGALALLWLDRRRSSVTRHQRAIWGDEHDFKFREADTKLRTVFRRATMNVPDHIAVENVAYGHYGGAEAVVFDLVETATVIAVRRSAPSSVVVDLRHEDVLAPAEDDVELLGAMGSRVMFSNNLDAARRVCDRRMVALANKAPAYVEVLWNEGNWALGSTPLTDDPAQLDTALEVVRRFADLLRVLPPLRDPQDAPDPRDPHGPTRAELADEKTENTRDERRRARVEAMSREERARDEPEDVPTGMHNVSDIAARPRRRPPTPDRRAMPTDVAPLAPVPDAAEGDWSARDDADPDFADTDFADEPRPSRSRGARPRSARTGPSEMPVRRNRHRQ